MRTLASLAATLAALAVAVPSAAQTSAMDPAPVVLRWNAPPECPTGDQVLDDARTLAPRSTMGAPQTPPAPPPNAHRDAAGPRSAVTVAAVVERIAEGRWALTLAIGASQRKVEASSCAQLARAGALFVALVMAPSPGASPAEAESDASPAPPPPPAPAPTAAPGKREVYVLAAAGLALESGILPRAEPLGALDLGIRYRRMEVSLRGTAGPAQDKVIAGGAGVRLRPLSAMLAPCYAPLVTGRLRLGPCIWGEVGWMHAGGTGVSQPRTTDAPWLSLGGALVAWLGVGAHFEARLGAGILVPVVRPDFELTGAGSVFQPGVAVRADVAGVVRF
jgi:hypothetical protein